MKGDAAVTCGMRDSAFVGADLSANFAANAQRRPAAPTARSSRPGTFAPVSGPLKNVGEATSAIPMAAPQKQAKKRSLRVENEHFEPVFNAAMATQVVFQQPVSGYLAK